MLIDRLVLGGVYIRACTKLFSGDIFFVSLLLQRVLTVSSLDDAAVVVVELGGSWGSFWIFMPQLVVLTASSLTLFFIKCLPLLRHLFGEMFL